MIAPYWLDSLGADDKIFIKGTTSQRNTVERACHSKQPALLSTTFSSAEECAQTTLSTVQHLQDCFVQKVQRGHRS